MSAHKAGPTPGPWKFERLQDSAGNHYATNYLAHIDIGPCMVWCPPGNAEQEANARLIAAAPDLLEALEKCSRFIETWSDCLAGVQMSDETFRADSGLAEARAALAKAVQP